MEVLRLPVSSLGTEGNGKIPVKIVDGYRGKACIDHFIKGRIQLFTPVPHQRCLPSSGRTGKKTEAFRLRQIIEAEKCFLILASYVEDLFGVL